MSSTKRVISLLTAGGLALTMAGALSTTTAASVRSDTNTTAKLAAVQVGGPMVRANGVKNQTYSLNWSGYAALRTKSKFNYVHSEWVQPAITCTGVKDQWVSTWVGLDGFSDGTVEQDGTSAHCGGVANTTPSYAAWFEMFPAIPVTVFKVRPGDVIEASVGYSPATKLFSLSLADLSTHVSSGMTAACHSCKRSSAEAVIERPAYCNDSLTHCFLTALADFGSVTMTDATAGVGIRARGIGTFKDLVPMDMVQPSGSSYYLLDSTGPITPATDAFTETFLNSGQPYPITLGPKS